MLTINSWTSLLNRCMFLWMTKPLERGDVSNKRVTTLFEQAYVSNKLVKKVVQLLDKQLVNEKPLVYAFVRDMTKLILQPLFLVIYALCQLLMNSACTNWRFERKNCLFMA